MIPRFQIVYFFYDTWTDIYVVPLRETSNLGRHPLPDMKGNFAKIIKLVQVFALDRWDSLTSWLCGCEDE